MPLYNEHSLGFDAVKKLITEDDAFPLNAEEIQRPDTNPNATSLGYDAKPLKKVKLSKPDTTPLNTEEIQRPDTNPNATSLGYDTKALKNVKLSKPDTTPLNTEVIDRPAINPNATGLGYNGKILSFEEVKKFMEKSDATPITTINVQPPVALNPVATDLNSKNTTTPLNTTPLKAPDFNPNAKTQTTPVTSVDIHPQVLPVVVPNIKAAEDNSKAKDEKYIEDGFGSFLNDCGCQHMNADGGHKSFGADGFLNASGTPALAKGEYVVASTVTVYTTPALTGNKVTWNKGSKFHSAGQSNPAGTAVKVGAKKVVYYLPNNFATATYVTKVASTGKKKVTKPAAKAAAKATAPSAGVSVVDANTFYVTTSASTTSYKDPKTGKPVNKSVPAQNMNNHNHKVTAAIDTTKSKTVGGKTYYQITKMYVPDTKKWENRINTNAKLPTLWVLKGDYKPDTTIKLSAEGMYMDGVNGYGKPNSLYASGTRFKSLRDTASGYYTNSGYYNPALQMAVDGAMINQEEYGSQVSQLQNNYQQGQMYVANYATQMEIQQLIQAMQSAGLNSSQRMLAQQILQSLQTGLPLNPTQQAQFQQLLQYAGSAPAIPVQHQYVARQILDRMRGGRLYDDGDGDTGSGDYGGDDTGSGDYGGDDTGSGDYGGGGNDGGGDMGGGDMGGGGDDMGGGGGGYGGGGYGGGMMPMMPQNTGALALQQLQATNPALAAQIAANPALAAAVQANPALLNQITANPALVNQIAANPALLTQLQQQTATTTSTGVAGAEAGVNGTFFQNGINTQPYTLNIDTYYPVTNADGSSTHVPLPAGSIIWSDAPFVYANIAPEHKGSFPDPTDANNQFQRYSWASVDGITPNGGLIPMRKDTITINTNYAPPAALSDTGSVTSPAPAKTPAKSDVEKEEGMATWEKAVIGAGVIGLVGAVWYFGFRKKK